MMKQFFCAVAVALLCISCSSPKQKAEQDMFVSVLKSATIIQYTIKGRFMNR